MTPIVIATGVDGMRDEALAAGAALVLAKPFGHDELLGALAGVALPGLSWAP